MRNTSRRWFSMNQPGSKVAIEQGCICPRKQNNFGQGYGHIVDGTTTITQYYIADDCPVHVPPSSKMKGVRNGKGKNTDHNQPRACLR